MHACCHSLRNVCSICLLILFSKTFFFSTIFTSYRYIYICHPSSARIWCTNARVTKVIVSIFLAAFIHQSSRFVESYYTDVVLLLNDDQSGGGQQPVTNVTMMNESPMAASSTTFVHQPACRFVTANWVMGIENVYFVSYFTFRIIFVHIGPCLALVIFNVLLYHALKQVEATRARLFVNSNLALMNSHKEHFHQNGGGECRRLTAVVNGDPSAETTRLHNENISRMSMSIELKRMQHHTHANAHKGIVGRNGRDANSTTFMLIVVVTVFLIVEIPLAITTAVHVTENVFELELVSDHALNMIIVCTNFFIIITYPLNFAIYCGMSKAFRETFQQIFVRRIVATTSFTASKLPGKKEATNNGSKVLDEERRQSTSGTSASQGPLNHSSSEVDKQTNCDHTPDHSAQSSGCSPMDTNGQPSVQCNNGVATLTFVDLNGKTQTIEAVNHANEHKTQTDIRANFHETML